LRAILGHTVQYQEPKSLSLASACFYYIFTASIPDKNCGYTTVLIAT